MGESRASTEPAPAAPDGRLWTESASTIIANVIAIAGSLSGFAQALRSGQPLWLLVVLVAVLFFTVTAARSRRWRAATGGAIATVLCVGGLAVVLHLHEQRPTGGRAAAAVPTGAAPNAAVSSSGGANNGGAGNGGAGNGGASTGAGSAGGAAGADGGQVLVKADVELTPGQAIDVDAAGHAPVGGQFGATGAYDLFLERNVAYGLIHTHDGVYSFSGSLNEAATKCAQVLDPADATAQYTISQTVSPEAEFCFATSDGHVAVGQVDSASAAKVLLHVRVWSATVPAEPGLLLKTDVVLAKGQAVDLDRPGQQPVGHQIGAKGANDLFLEANVAYGLLHTHDGLYSFGRGVHEAAVRCRDALDPSGPPTAQFVTTGTVSPGADYCFATSEGRVALVQVDRATAEPLVLAHIRVWQTTA